MIHSYKSRYSRKKLYSPTGIPQAILALERGVPSHEPEAHQEQRVLSLLSVRSSSRRFRKRGIGLEWRTYLICIPISDQVSRNGTKNLREYLPVFSSSVVPQIKRLIREGIGNKTVFGSSRFILVRTGCGSHEGRNGFSASLAHLRRNQTKML
jgi:hypothetical protein